MNCVNMRGRESKLVRKLSLLTGPASETRAVDREEEGSARDEVTLGISRMLPENRILLHHLKSRPFSKTAQESKYKEEEEDTKGPGCLGLRRPVFPPNLTLRALRDFRGRTEAADWMWEFEAHHVVSHTNERPPVRRQLWGAAALEGVGGSFSLPTSSNASIVQTVKGVEYIPRIQEIRAVRPLFNIYTYS